MTTKCTAADAAVAAASAKLSNLQSFELADLKAIVKIREEGQVDE